MVAHQLGPYEVKLGAVAVEHGLYHVEAIFLKHFRIELLGIFPSTIAIGSRLVNLGALVVGFPLFQHDDFAGFERGVDDLVAAYWKSTTFCGVGVDHIARIFNDEGLFGVHVALGPFGSIELHLCHLLVVSGLGRLIFVLFEEPFKLSDGLIVVPIHFEGIGVLVARCWVDIHLSEVHQLFVPFRSIFVIA